MKKYLLFTMLTCGITLVKGQNVGIGTPTPNANAKLDIVDAEKGILIPRMDSTHRVAIPNTQGMLVYDTTDNCFWYNDGTKWLKFIVTHNADAADKISMTHLYLITGF